MIATMNFSHQVSSIRSTEIAMPDRMNHHLRNKLKVRRFLSEIIATLPFNGLRCWAYSRLGYKVRNSRIGWRSVIAVEDATLDTALISRFNKIVGPLTLVMEKHAAIGSKNEIVCGNWAINLDHQQFSYARTFVMEEHSVITSQHMIDVVDRIRIGAGTHIAGIRSEFWTHGYAAGDRSIDIGLDCFVGSSVIFLPGARVADRSVVAAGAVVSRRYNSPFSLIAGNPPKVIRNYYWRSRKRISLDDPPSLPEELAHLDRAAGDRPAP